MADFRTHKSIADRGDVAFGRYPNKLREKRRIVTWATFVLSLVVAAGFLIYDDKTMYWGGEVSTAHQLVRNDCKQCHNETFQPLKRLLNVSNDHFSVSAESCRSCHAGIHATANERIAKQRDYLALLPKDHPFQEEPGRDQPVQDHNLHMTSDAAESVSNCAICHKEHLGADQLAWVSDAHCTNCHSDLQADHGDPAFKTAISSFGNHPPFALHRDQPVADEHLVHQVATHEAEGGWKDRSNIRFNHAMHLNPKGIPIPPGSAPGDEPIEREKLDCQSCHVPDDAGQYMQPIRYDNHCQKCHSLEFSTKLSLVGKTQSMPLPHASPELIHGVLRDHLMAYAKSHPNEVLTNKTGHAQDLPRDPNHEPREAVTAKDEWDWTEKMVAIMEKGIRFGTDDKIPSLPEEIMSEKSGGAIINATSQANDIISQVQFGCAHCHVVESQVASSQAQDTMSSSWKIAPTNIPDRWMPHSRFDHGRHTEVSCTVCHSGPEVDRKTIVLGDVGARTEKTTGGNDPSEPQLTSEFATDILMPSIDVCRACHGKTPGAIALVGHRGAARDNCVECHVFHHPQQGHPKTPPAGKSPTPNSTSSSNPQ